MDSHIHIEQLEADQIAELIANPEGLREFIFSNSDDWEGTARVAISDDNGWQTIHCLLTGDGWDGAWPLNFMASVTVGTPVSYDGEFPPAKFFSAQEVQTISEALEGITTSELLSRFDAGDDEISTFDCPHEAFKSEEEFLNDFVSPRFEEIKKFVADAASKDRGLLVAWAML